MQIKHYFVSVSVILFAGSKIPAATSTSEKGRAERSGLFAGMPSPAAVKDIKRTTSFNNKCEFAVIL